MRQVFIIKPQPKDSLVSTEYGILRFYDWCMREKKRMGHHCVVKKFGNLVGVATEARFLHQRVK